MPKSDAVTLLRPELQQLPAPSPLGNRHCPIPHYDLFREMHDRLVASGAVVVKERHVVSHGGNRYFATMELIRNFAVESHRGYRTMVGLRNSHDRYYPVTALVGATVMVCSNGSMFADFVLSRRHTPGFRRDLPGLVDRAVEKIFMADEVQERAFDAYARHKLSRQEADHILMRSFRQGIVPVTDLARISQEYDDPSHEEFGPRTAWSLFNAFTEVAKGWAPSAQAERTRKLHRLFDEVSGFSIAV